MKPINWSWIFERVGKQNITKFVSGDVSGRRLYELGKLTGSSGEVRTLLRTRGVNEARQLARKALSRR